jgi:hypothetical protein
LRDGTTNEAFLAVPVEKTVPVNSGMINPVPAFEGLTKPAVWRRESASDTVRALEKMVWKPTIFLPSCANRLTKRSLMQYEQKPAGRRVFVFSDA